MLFTASRRDASGFWRRWKPWGALCALIEPHLPKGDRGRPPIGTSTIVDATIIAAPSSTKNADGTRDPEMHQVEKGNQWHFGMKALFCVDSLEKIIHTVVATPANVLDSQAIGQLLHGKETNMWATAPIRARSNPSRQPHLMPRT